MPSSGNTNDSIIELRRGARTASGQLSFSISVHTASGRTIHFDNTDFDDSDDDIVDVDRQTGLITVTRSNNRSLDRNIGHNESSDEESDEDFLDNENYDEEVINFGHIPSDNTSDDSYEHVNESSNNENIQQNAENSTASQRSPSSAQSMLFMQPLTNTVSEVSNSSNSDNSTQSQSASGTSSGSTQSVSGSTQSVSGSTQSTSGSQSTYSQPRNNSLYFVLQSNTGRRILNLRYMDSYSESEKMMLQKKIHNNAKRLIGYAEECNVGRGFIKELGFSADGRFICSPFGFGIRLFGFDSNCNELCDCVPSSPVKLYEVTCSLAHGNCVVAAKFSPTHNMVVSGCLDGKIAFHQPVL